MSAGIEALAAEDTAEACALFERVFGHPVTPQRWHWKYAQGPRLAGLNLVYRNAQGHIVGHVGASVFEGIAAGRFLPMAQLSDVMVDPQARGALDPQGVYGQLMRAMQAALQQQFPGVFAYGFVGIRPSRLGVRMGMYKPHHECRNGLLTALPERTQVSRWREGFAQAQPVDWGDALEAPWLDRLWQRASARQRRPAVARTARYMRWRYAEHPEHRYQLWWLRRWGQVAGWMVTRHMPSGQVQLIDQCPLPAATVADAAGQAAMSALYRELPSAPEAPAVLASWSLDTEEARRLEPMIGAELWPWHENLPPPVFMPGDTDVF